MIIIENGEITWNGLLNFQLIKDILSQKRIFQHITYYNINNIYNQGSIVAGKTYLTNTELDIFIKGLLTLGFKGENIEEVIETINVPDSTKRVLTLDINKSKYEAWNETLETDDIILNSDEWKRLININFKYII